jgi:hypothetical protein
MSAAPAILTITRDPYPADPEAPTMGVMTADGLKGPIYSLEDPWKENAPDVSCIPEGEYPLAYTMSKRFKHETPEIQKVPGRSGIRIHGGNTEADTLGCPLVGTIRNPDGMSIRNCAPAKVEVDRWLIAALARGPAVCRVVRTPPPSSVPLV